MSGSRVYLRALTVHGSKIWVAFNFVSIFFDVSHFQLREHLVPWYLL